MRVKASSGMTLLMLVIAAGALVIAARMGYRARLFPVIVSVPMLGLALGQLALDLREAHERAQEAKDEAQADPVELPADVARRRALSMNGWLLALLALVWLIGFTPAITLFVFAFLLAEAKTRLVVSGIAAAGMWAFLHFVMGGVFHLLMPQGVLWAWLNF